MQVFMTLVEGQGSNITDYEAYQMQRDAYEPVQSGCSESVKIGGTGKSDDSETLYSKRRLSSVQSESDE